MTTVYRTPNSFFQDKTLMVAERRFGDHNPTVTRLIEHGGQYKICQPSGTLWFGTDKDHMLGMFDAIATEEERRWKWLGDVEIDMEVPIGRLVAVCKKTKQSPLSVEILSRTGRLAICQEIAPNSWESSFILMARSASGNLARSRDFHHDLSVIGDAVKKVSGHHFVPKGWPLSLPKRAELVDAWTRLAAEGRLAGSAMDEGLKKRFAAVTRMKERASFDAGCHNFILSFIAKDHGLSLQATRNDAGEILDCWIVAPDGHELDHMGFCDPDSGVARAVAHGLVPAAVDVDSLDFSRINADIAKRFVFWHRSGIEAHFGGGFAPNSR